MLSASTVHHQTGSIFHLGLAGMAEIVATALRRFVSIHKASSQNVYMLTKPSALQRLFERQSLAAAQQREAYAWSVESM